MPIMSASTRSTTPLASSSDRRARRHLAALALAALGILVVSVGAGALVADVLTPASETVLAAPFRWAL
jgi:hypothetical protein